MVLVAGVCFSVEGNAQQLAGPPSFRDWMQELRTEAVQSGISAGTVDVALRGVEPIPRVLELDRKQPEFTLTLNQYLARVVPDARVAQGQANLRQHRALLTEIEKKYGVPARFIVAFWGVETDFGRITGGFPVVSSLATLAHDGRRSSYFRKELLNALRIIDQGHITADSMVGSWAGAMGQCQFMPSSFLSFAVDYSGDGKKDIWSTPADVFASAANYLARSGWDSDLTWGREVKLPQGAEGRFKAGEKKSLLDWHAFGVRRADGSALSQRDLQASLVVPDRGDGRAYLAYGNFETILKWNRSTFFAIGVGTLADRIGG
ncbi:MAG: lytic murein transglycosylase [Proteobacteria bacterium]|nr:lytic murein transglycosylase [Pseudomonadota bacterium]